MILGAFIYMISGFLFVVIYLAIDNIITRKKIERNQILWDEYSKYMSEKEKSDVYLDWVKQNKYKHGDKFYYFPKM